MTIKERMNAARVIDKMNSMKNYSRTLGLKDCSTFHGQPVNRPNAGKAQPQADAKPDKLPER